MSDVTEWQDNMSQFCEIVIAPLAQIFLRHGFSYKVFSEIAKRVFASVAFEEFGVSGREANNAKVAALLGISRKEVARLKSERAREYSSTSGEIWKNFSRLSTVLYHWHSDPSYIDTDGNPKPLKLTGDGVSFARLVKKTKLDSTPRSVLKLLMEAGCIEEIDGLFVAKKRDYIPAPHMADFLWSAGIQLSDLLRTYIHNMTSPDRKEHWLARFCESKISISDAHTFRIISSEKVKKLIFELDDWLEDHRVPDDDPGAGRVGVGAYFFLDEPN